MQERRNSIANALWLHLALTHQIIIGLDNGLSPVQHPAITWTNDGFLSNGCYGTDFNEIWIETQYM